MLLALRVPADNTRGPLFMEQALAGIHAGNPRRLPITFGMTCAGGAVHLYCDVPSDLKPLVEGQLYAQFPDASLTPLDRDPVPEGHVVCSADLTLDGFVFPIKRHAQFDDPLHGRTADPIAALLAGLRRENKDGIVPSAEITVVPAGRALIARAGACLDKLVSTALPERPRLCAWFLRLALSRSHFCRLFSRLIAKAAGPSVGRGPPLSQSTGRLHEREDDLQAASDKLGRKLFECRLRLTVTLPPKHLPRAHAFLDEMAGAFGQFSAPRLAAFRVVRAGRGERRIRRLPKFLLSNEELATLFHPATVSVRTPTLASVESREFSAPASLPTPGIHPGLAILGRTAYRGTGQRFGILPDDRLRHLAILGKTGMGKSTLLHHLLASDMEGDRGVGLIDPHGDLVEAVLRSVPRRRSNDLILFDAGDALHPLAFNVLDCPHPKERPLVASGVVSAFKKVYGDSWGPRLEHILRNTLLTLLDVPGSTLLTALRLLSDARFRAQLLTQVSDPVVRTFWEREFAGMPPKLQAEAIAPIQNKLGHFVSSPLLRNIVCQSESKLRLRSVLDTGKILLVNLAKGRIGDDASALLGAFLTTQFQIAAMSRADLPEPQRRDFFLYVDEFQNFATPAFATILSEARKYRLSLTLANQYLAQLDEATLHAVFGNVGTMIAFQVGARDAEILAEQFGGDLTPQDLLRLPRFQAYVRLLIEGMPSLPFTMATLPPPTVKRHAADPAVLRRTSRHRYARPVGQVESHLQAALTMA